MKTHALYPLMFQPVYKDYLWGGTAIAQRYNRANAPRQCAESWELSGIADGISVVSNGAFEGIGLDALAQTFGRELTGTKAADPEVFPLLIKVLDAHERLSVQVHPDADAAQLLGGAPKHEMWYVLEAQPEAKLWAGVRAGADLTRLAEEDLLAHQPAAGDVLDIPAGMVHAIGAGNLIYEVQQPSNTTYRLHDWGRGRPTQPEQALRATRPQLVPSILPAPTETRRNLCPRLMTQDFAFATLTLLRERTLHTTAQSFMVLFCTEGKVSLTHEGPHPLTLLPGDLVLIPPLQRVTLHPLAPSHLLVTTL